MLSTDEKSCSDIDKSLWRLVEYFLKYRKSAIIQQRTADDMWVYLSSSFLATVGDDRHYPPAAAVIDWLAEGHGDADPADQVINLAMAVASNLDSYHDTPAYSSKLSQLVDGELGRPLSQVLAGNGSIN